MIVSAIADAYQSGHEAAEKEAAATAKEAPKTDGAKPVEKPVAAVEKKAEAAEEVKKPVKAKKAKTEETK